MASYRDGLKYKDELERHVMLITAGKKVPAKPGAPKLTKKDQEYLAELKKEVAAEKKARKKK